MAKPQATHGRRSGHESTDVRIGWVVFAAALLVVSGLVVHFTIWRFQEWRVKRSASAAISSRPAVDPGSTAAFTSVPPPRLQLSPSQDLSAFLKDERERLSTYGWVNRTAGIVHIPIERAMDLIAQRGLPVRQNQTGGKTPLELLQERRNREAEETGGIP